MAGELLRDAMAHRPLQRALILLRNFAPSPLDLTFGPCNHPGRTDWRAKLVLGEDEIEPHMRELITYSRAALVAALPKWIADEMGDVDFERVTDHDEPIPF